MLHEIFTYNFYNLTCIHVYGSLTLVHGHMNCNVMQYKCYILILIFQGGRAFSIAGPKLWNSLPVSIRTIPTESLLKTRLKANLFERAFDVVSKQEFIISDYYLFVFTIFMYFESF